MASKGWIVCMWFHQEVANHPVVVHPRGACSLVQLAAMVWFQAAAPVLTLLRCMYAFVLHVTEVPLGFACSTYCTSQSYLCCENDMESREEFL